MSYSFTVRGTTKDEAKTLVSEELAKVVQYQPVHAADHEQAQATADAFIDVLPDADDKDVLVTMHGSVAWNGTQEEPVITGANVSIGATLVIRESSAVGVSDQG